jgi:tetratricopeptide (TPR) repeat protein
LNGWFSTSVQTFFYFKEKILMKISFKNYIWILVYQVKKLVASFFLIIVICTSNFVVRAQNKQQPLLEQEIKVLKSDSDRVNFLNKKGEDFLNEGNFENSLYYLNKALKIAKQKQYFNKSILLLQNIGNVYSDMGKNKEALNFYNEALTNSKKIDDKIGISQSLNLIGIVNQFEGNYDQAIAYYEEALKTNLTINYKVGIVKNYTNIGNSYFYKGNYLKALKNHEASLKIARELNDNKNISNSLNNISICFLNQGNYTEALNYSLSSLKINEASNNKKLIADNYLNIGLIYYYQKNYDDALKYQLSSLKINKELANKRDVAANLTNISIIYIDLNKFDLALKNENEALQLNLQTDYKNGIAKNYRNIGSIYLKDKNFDKALESFKSSLKIDKDLNDLESISASNCHIAEVLIQQKKYNEARNILAKNLNISLISSNKLIIKEYYAILSKLDSIQFNWKEAYYNSNLYHVYKDSLINEGNTKKLVQSQMQYEFDKKQASEKIVQATKDAINSQEKKRQKVITIAVSVGLLLVLVFAIVLLNRFRVTLKQKKIIEIQKQKVEIQKELIEEKNKQVTDSINYAKRIQTAILPPISVFKKNLTQSFILYMPKDIVAGDFYWQEKMEDYILFAACDCTGHGVPGAMVSVVCNNALNRSVREFNIIKPSEILDKTLAIVIENFYNSEDEIRDGMDIALCAFNKTTKLLQYAGANNPLWIVRDNELIEVKADKQCIGYNYKEKPFTNNEIQLFKDDVIYLSSDGYSDQFGGETGKKKLTKKRFKELLLSIHQKDIDKQASKLNEFINQYKGPLDQIDDILVIGFRV